MVNKLWLCAHQENKDDMSLNDNMYSGIQTPDHVFTESNDVPDPSLIYLACYFVTDTTNRARRAGEIVLVLWVTNFAINITHNHMAQLFI